MAWTPLQFAMNGGVNEQDAQFSLPMGALVFSRNYECRQGGGYRRMDGYERYDSQTSPSTATYNSYQFSLGSVAPTDQLAVKGGTSGATGVVCGTTQLDGGSYAAGTGAGFVALTNITGTFQSGEWLEKSSDSSHLVQLASTATAQSGLDQSYGTWIAGARNYLRSLITMPAGYGPILGGFVLGGYTYAWRATAADHTKQALYKATGGAWNLITLTKYLRYSTGTLQVNEGDTITGASSGATAVVRRINIGAGNYTGPTFASGRFAIDTITGTFSNGENLQVSAVTVAVCVGTQTTPTMTATAARHQTIVNNFFGASNWIRAYGCDRVNRGYEFDGTIFINIETGMAVDVPTNIDEHRNFLFFSFAGGSVQNSATGLPLNWAVRLGAGEIAIGDDVTGIKSNGNNTLAILGLKRTFILQGTSPDDWTLKSVSDEVGSLSFSVQETAGQTLFLDRGGINIVIPAPFAYQDLSTQVLSRAIKPTIEASAPNCIDSIHDIKKNQYRLFFNDKTAIVATFNAAKLIGFTYHLYPDQITCSWAGLDTNGVERMFAGTSGGYVMMLDVGASFDGQKIESLLQLPFSYCKSPDRDKRFHKLRLEMSEVARPFDLYYGLDFNYGASQQPGRYLLAPGTTSPIDSFALFGTLFWNTNVLSAPEMNIEGIGQSIGIAIYNNDDAVDAFTISAGMLQFTNLGIVR